MDFSLPINWNHRRRKQYLALFVWLQELENWETQQRRHKYICTQASGLVLKSIIPIIVETSVEAESCQTALQTLSQTSCCLHHKLHVWCHASVDNLCHQFKKLKMILHETKPVPHSSVWRLEMSESYHCNYLEVVGMSSIPLPYVSWLRSHKDERNNLPLPQKSPVVYHFHLFLVNTESTDLMLLCLRLGWHWTELGAWYQECFSVLLTCNSAVAATTCARWGSFVLVECCWDGGCLI